MPYRLVRKSGRGLKRIVAINIFLLWVFQLGNCHWFQRILCSHFFSMENRSFFENAAVVRAQLKPGVRRFVSLSLTRASSGNDRR